MPALALAWTHTRQRETGRGFKFEDDEIVDYVRALVVAGANQRDANSHDLDAWKTLEKVKGGTVEVQG